MDRVFQVFVSSTFTDLQEERRLASNNLAKAGYFSAGMELFPAADQDQFEYIKRIIDRSDYYVVITAGRYGSLASDGLSYTEKECDYAMSRSIPVLAFLHENPGSLPADKCEKTNAGRAHLSRFNEKLKTGRMVDFWSNRDELCTKIVIAVANQANLKPGLGWVRGDNAIDPKFLQEIERLRSENADLKAAIAKASGSLTVDFDPSVKGPDTPLSVRLIEKNTPNGGKLKEEIHPIETTFKEVFLSIYEELCRGSTETLISGAIAKAVGRSLSPHPNRQSITVDYEDYLTIRNQFEALGLIELNSTPGLQLGARNRLVWIITDKGRRYFASNSALRSTAS